MNTEQLSKQKFKDNFFIDFSIVKARAAKEGLSLQKTLTLIINEEWAKVQKKARS